jgi:hypothetical protein
MNSELQTLIENLALTRDLADEIKCQMNEMIEGVKASRAYKELSTTLAEHSDVRDMLILDIDKAALEAYAADGNKKPHDAVQVKIFTVVNPYDIELAREWCMTNFRPALKLDAKTFEKAVKDKTVPAELATTSDEPRVQIATDLKDYIK